MMDHITVSLNDTIIICMALDKEIERRSKEEMDFVDSTIGKPLGEIVGVIAGWSLYDMEALVEARNRLFNQIPEEYL